MSINSSIEFPNELTVVTEEEKKNANEFNVETTNVSSESLIEEVNSETLVETDPYFYIKRNEFTSEIYKIEIGNLPVYVGYKQLRSLLINKLKLKPHKVKVIGKPPKFSFVTFRSEEDRDKALEVLQGYQWKGREIFAKKANPMADPLVKKRTAGDAENSPAVKKAREEEKFPVNIRLKNAVTPLWEMPYEMQLKKKEEEMHQFLVKLGRQIEKINKSMSNRLHEQRKNNEFQCCPLLPIKASPVISAYRNKCEFTVGKHLDTGERTVGFRLSRYKEGSMSVAEVDDCINIPESMLKAVKAFQQYVQMSEKDVFDPETHNGYWRQLTVRTTRNNDILLIVVMHPQSLSQEELEKEKTKLKEYFSEGNGSSCKVTSLYFQAFSKKQSEDNMSSFEHLNGKKCIEESLLELKFQISPEAFFQVNTAAAEVLYTTVQQMAEVQPSTVLLDICCGTGTIGLSLAKKVEKVVGAESCKQAIENARINANLNNIDNANFICGKAEDVIYDIMQQVRGSDVVAIVDPPRAGLHSKVLKALRANEELKRLVYMACNPTAAMTNFVDLCRPSSNNYRGNPFYPTKAVAVDLFPHTPHCELVILFDRIESGKVENSKS